MCIIKEENSVVYYSWALSECVLERFALFVSLCSLAWSLHFEVHLLTSSCMWRLQEVGLTSKLAPQPLSAGMKERHEGLPTRLGRFPLSEICNMQELFVVTWKVERRQMVARISPPRLPQHHSLHWFPHSPQIQTSLVPRLQKYYRGSLLSYLLYSSEWFTETYRHAKLFWEQNVAVGLRTPFSSWPSFIKGCSLLPHLYYSVAQSVV